MDILSWIAAETAKKLLVGESPTGVVRNVHGRFFVEISQSGIPNWDPARNIFIERYLDLGEFPTD